MRHGQAAYLPDATAVTVASDAKRPLTEQGRQDVARVIEARKASLSDLDIVLTSPYRRARETAEIVMQGLGFSGQLLVCNELTPASDLSSVAKLLDNLIDKSGINSMLLASHQPLVGEVLNRLTGEVQLRSIEPAWLVALETEAVLPGYADFRWLQRPGE